MWDCCKNGQRPSAWSITALCGYGIGCPESRDSSEQEAEGAELGELREQGRWRQGGLGVETHCFGHIFVHGVGRDWDQRRREAKSASNMKRGGQLAAVCMVHSALSLEALPQRCQLRRLSCQHLFLSRRSAELPKMLRFGRHLCRHKQLPRQGCNHSNKTRGYFRGKKYLVESPLGAQQSSALGGFVSQH